MKNFLSEFDAEGGYEKTASDPSLEFILDENCEEIAKSLGCFVVVPEKNQLQLDIDGDDAYAFFEERIVSAPPALGWEKYTVREYFSKSGRNRHITITVQGAEFSNHQRIALQTLFGSDPVWEGLNAVRVELGVDVPIRLFKPIERVADENEY